VTHLDPATLRWVAREVTGAIRLFLDTEECATVIGALEGLADRMNRLADKTSPPEITPRRGDPFEVWLTAQRDACFGHASSWAAVDGLLEEYRSRADAGVPLEEPLQPSDAEIVEEARKIGMAEPEKAPEIVAAARKLLAQSGIDTPGCDCGHDGMGPGWHLKTCGWLNTLDVPHPDRVTVDTPRPGARGLLDHVGLDSSGKDIRVGDRVVDAWDEAEPAASSADVAPPTEQAADSVRAQLLAALDFSACLNLGYTTPEALLAAYDASRTPEQAALREQAGRLSAKANKPPGCAHCGSRNHTWNDCEEYTKLVTTEEPNREMLFWDESVGASLAEGRITIPLVRAQSLASFTPAGDLILRIESARTLRDMLSGVLRESDSPVDGYEAVTGHLTTCLAVAGGEADPDCPCQAEHEWIYRVTAASDGKKPKQSQYYPTARQARFWKEKVEDVGYQARVGRIPAEAFEALSDEALDGLAEAEEPG